MVSANKASGVTSGEEMKPKAVICVAVFFVCHALLAIPTGYAAEPAPGTPICVDIEQGRILLKQGEAGKALDVAKEIAARSAADRDTVLAALEVMAQCYEQLGDWEKEVNCYEQIGTMEWLPRFSKDRRKRMMERIEAIAGKVETATADAETRRRGEQGGRGDAETRGRGEAEKSPTLKQVGRLSTIIMGLRKPLLLDEVFPGGAEALALRMLEARAKAHEALGEKERARADRLAALAAPVPSMLQRRYEAAIALVEKASAAEMAEAEAALLSLLLDSADDQTAFVCQAALTRAATLSAHSTGSGQARTRPTRRDEGGTRTVGGGQAPFGALRAGSFPRTAAEKEPVPGRENGASPQAQLKRLFYLCPPQDAALNILADEAGQLAQAKDKAGLAPDAGMLLAQFAARRPAVVPQGGTVAGKPAEPGGKWEIAGLVFPAEALKGALPDAELASIRTRLAGLRGKDPATARRRVRLLLLLGEIDAALSEAYAAYQAAPRGLNVQMDAVRDFIAAAKARSGVFLAPKPFLAFAAFGPAGRDGKLGTDDDLEDPFLQLVSKK